MASHKITWIGTGNAFSYERGHTSFTISGPGKRALLVDCGGTVPLRLMETERFAQVTDVLLTHLHADHTGGLEGFIFFNYFALGRQTDNKLRIHVATDEFAHRLWEHTLRGGMEFNVDEEMNPLTMVLEDYVEVHVNETVQVEGLPPVRFFPTLHVTNMENYGLRIGENVIYSGDTIEAPSLDADLIFQDCDFRHPRVPGIHLPYDLLLEAVPRLEDRGRIYLTHTGGNANLEKAAIDGFAGVLQPGDEFDI